VIAGQHPGCDNTEPLVENRKGYKAKIAPCRRFSETICGYVIEGGEEHHVGE